MAGWLALVGETRKRRVAAEDEDDYYSSGNCFLFAYLSKRICLFVNNI